MVAPAFWSAAVRSFHYPQAGSGNRPIPKGLQPPAQGWRPAPTLGVGAQTSATPTGLCRAAHGKDTTPLGLTPIPTASPRVARAAQPWALGRNPVGIQTPARGELWVIHRVRGRFLARGWGTEQRQRTATLQDAGATSSGPSVKLTDAQRMHLRSRFSTPRACRQPSRVVPLCPHDSAQSC